MKKHKSVFSNVLQLIGDTPLVKLNNITSSFKGNFYAKLESFNPGHSSKDRIALFIIEEAERNHILGLIDTCTNDQTKDILCVQLILHDQNSMFGNPIHPYG